MTYNVFGGTLSLTQSINQSIMGCNDCSGSGGTTTTYLSNEEISVHQSDPAEREETKHDVHDVVDVISQRAFVGVRYQAH